MRGSNLDTRALLLLMARRDWIAGRERAPSASHDIPANFLRHRWAVAAVLAFGLFVLYAPTYADLATTVWAGDEQGHGPLIVALCAWLAVQRWMAFAALPDRPSFAAGGVVLLLGLAMQVLGQSQGIQTSSAASQIAVLGGLVLLFKGLPGFRLMAVPLFFLVFAVPLPGILVQTLTVPLKSAVSACAEWLLHFADYPVARTGVVLSVGPYQMLVADACAGLNSMFTLEALGFLWMSLRPRASAWRNVLLAVLIVPISFTANVIRVLALVLVTYHLGDAAGRGFMHGFAGIVLFVAAVLLMLAADGVVRGKSPPLENT